MSELLRLPAFTPSVAPRGAAFALALLSARAAADPEATLRALQQLCSSHSTTGRFLASQRMFGMAVQNVVLADAWPLLPQVLELMTQRRTHPNKVMLTALMSTSLQRRAPLQALAAFDTFFVPPSQRMERVMEALRHDGRDRAMLQAAAGALQWAGVDPLTGEGILPGTDPATAAAAAAVGKLLRESVEGERAAGWFEDAANGSLAQPVMEMVERIQDAVAISNEINSKSGHKSGSKSSSNANDGGPNARIESPNAHINAGASGGSSDTHSAGNSSNDLEELLTVTTDSAPFTQLGARLMPQLLSAVRTFYAVARPSLLSAVAGVTTAVPEQRLESEWAALVSAVHRGCAVAAARTDLAAQLQQHHQQRAQLSQRHREWRRA